MRRILSQPRFRVLLSAVAALALSLTVVLSFAAFTDDSEAGVAVTGNFDAKITDPASGKTCSADAASQSTAVIVATNTAGAVIAYDAASPNDPTATYEITVCNTSQAATGNLVLAVRNARDTRGGPAAVGGIDPFDHMLMSVTDITTPATPINSIVRKSVAEINAGGGTVLTGSTIAKATSATDPGKRTFRINVWLNPASPGFQDAAYGQGMYPGIVVSSESNLLSGITDLQGVTG
ncbi:hypothetical protein G7066_12655 [Leucobacter coleopterorum]|uniref:Uncharacterized protein n=1 Tax=Leucobacter coleopterorum TaxID=2714933 RepID=A0ABX6K1T5_9MICO|nr:hypothetical protein [Leucobacter coleopterorum]QIM19207.1 hypothetical protein G7066_12655 [Leucobacter coleopterorum]